MEKIERPARKRVLTDVGTRSRTKKAHKAETDINLMVGRYAKTGVFPNLNQRTPMYGDFSEATSLEEAFVRVQDANESFMRLPAKVRAMAQNNPITFLEMLADEGGREALLEAGLKIDTTPEGENTAPLDAGAPSGAGVS